MMRNLSKHGIPTAQFVLEMDSISYIDRYISIDGMIDLETLVKYPETLTEEQQLVKNSVKESIKNNKYLYLRDKPSPSIKEIREKIIRLQERIGSKYIVVFIDLFDKIKNVTSRSDNLTSSFHISLNDIQNLAKELDVHFVLVAQINRESEKSQSKRPGLQNLKHSGAFEEVADLILFIDRPSYRILEEEIAEIDNAYQPARYVDGFNYESLDNFIKKYDSEVFENITVDSNLDAALQESISRPSIKDSGNLDSKLKEAGMVKVGNIVIPIKEYAEVIIAKQRRGVANKIIPFIYKGQYSMFISVNLVSPFSSGDKSI
jgi:replicative DNA helicase